MRLCACEIGKRQLEPRMKGRAERPGGEKYVRLEWRKIDEGAGGKAYESTTIVHIIRYWGAAELLL